MKLSTQVLCQIVAMICATTAFAAQEKSIPDPHDVIQCEGTIESFAKDGIHESGMDEFSGFWDATSITVLVPEEFAGVRHVVRSRGSGDISPLGPVGQRISFTANRSWLEFEKHPEKYTIDPKEFLEEAKPQS
jgi:hypothetical protein